MVILFINCIAFIQIEYFSNLTKTKRQNSFTVILQMSRNNLCT